jgi:hypothetical protein
MKKTLMTLTVLFVAVLMVGRSNAMEVKAGENSLNVDGRIQVLGALESVDDPWKDSERLFLFLKQARLNINGSLNGTDYVVQWMLGGEEVPERNSVMSLLDAYANIPLVEDTLELRLGQFMVPYGRERMVDSGYAFNTRRSIQNTFMQIGRDVGGLVHGKSGILTGAVGLFTGGGINIPQRYIPEDLEVPMFAARLGINTGVDQDVLTPASVDKRGENGFAVYVNGVYTKDSRVGHSTPLNVKYYDKSLMHDGDWNPYIGARDEKAEFWQGGIDVAAQLAVCDACDLLLTGEYTVSDFSNDAGNLQTSGGAVSANLIAENLAVGLRYAIVDPDSEMGYTGEEEVFAITDKNIQEITPSIVYSMPQYNVRLIADVAIQLDVPVSLETGHGVYNLMQQPDQVSRVETAGIEIQDNYLASLVIQYTF